MPRKAVYVWPLTPHQRAALISILGERIAARDDGEWVDALTGEEVTIGDLFTLLMQLEPTVVEAGS